MVSLHVTLMEFPEVFGYIGVEVGGAKVEDSRCEAKQTPRLEMPVAGAIRLERVSTGSQAVLFHCALEKKQLPILEMTRAHDFMVVNH